MIYAVLGLLLHVWAIEGSSREDVAPSKGERTHRDRATLIKTNHHSLDEPGTSRVKKEALIKSAVFPVTVNLNKFKNEIDKRMDKMSERISDNTDGISSNRGEIRSVKSHCEWEIEKLRGEIAAFKERSKITWIDTDESYTEIGSSLFKVFPGPADWATAKANCESTKVTAKMMGITMTAKGHLAYDKDDEIH